MEFRCSIFLKSDNEFNEIAGSFCGVPSAKYSPGKTR